MADENSSHRALIGAAALQARLTEPGCIVVDCRFDLMDPDAGRAAYDAGHIPGALYANLDRDLAVPAAANGTGGRHPLPDPERLGRLFAAWGVTPESTVVAYDDVGNAIAARLWWLLRWAGHHDAAVLDGGFTAWQAAGGDCSTAISVPEPSPGAYLPNPGAMPVIDADAVAAGLAEDRLVLLDARAADRFAGRSEPIDRVAGHVPGATNAPFQDNLDADKCFRPAGQLRAYYDAIIGERPIASVAAMCGSGVTACQTLLALEVAGRPGAALYVGSWSDWISSGRRAVGGDGSAATGKK